MEGAWAGGASSSACAWLLPLATLPRPPAQATSVDLKQYRINVPAGGSACFSLRSSPARRQGTRPLTSLSNSLAVQRCGAHPRSPYAFTRVRAEGKPPSSTSGSAASSSQQQLQQQQQAAPTFQAVFPAARDLLFLVLAKEVLVFDLELGVPAGAWGTCLRLQPSARQTSSRARVRPSVLEPALALGGRGAKRLRDGGTAPLAGQACVLAIAPTARVCTCSDHHAAWEPPRLHRLAGRVWPRHHARAGRRGRRRRRHGHARRGVAQRVDALPRSVCAGDPPVRLLAPLLTVATSAQHCAAVERNPCV